MATREDGKALAQVLMREWEFVPVAELEGGWCSVVYSDGSRVLKVPFQGEEQVTGAAAAERLAEAGVGPRVHRSDEATGALLTDLISPGEHLSKYGLDDDTAMPIFLDLAARARTCDSGGMMSLREYYETSSPLIDHLNATSPECVFLHGDLHHENILWGGDRWWAIDAKGLVGDPAFEAVAYLRNPIEPLGRVDDLAEFLCRRILAIAYGLGVSAHRVWAWSLADRESGNSSVGHPWSKMTVALRELEPRFGIDQDPHP